MSPMLAARDNNALNVNPDVFHYFTTTDIGLTTHGSDWVWALTALMALAFIIVAALSLRLAPAARTFHHIFAIVLLVSAISAFTVASNLGYTPILVEFRRSGNVAGATREIFYVRYIDWFINWPLLLLALFLTSATPITNMLYTMFLSWVWVVSFLVGALVSSRYKWGYYVFGVVAYLGIVYQLFTVGRKYASGIGREVSRPFTVGAAWLAFIWLLYPICWGVSEGGNVIAPDSEAVFYGILDILSKVGLAAYLLWSHRNIDPALIGFHHRTPTDGFGDRKAVASGGVHPGVHKEENVTAPAV